MRKKIVFIFSISMIGVIGFINSNIYYQFSNETSRKTSQSFSSERDTPEISFASKKESSKASENSIYNYKTAYGLKINHTLSGLIKKTDFCLKKENDRFFSIVKNNLVTCKYTPIKQKYISVFYNYIAFW